MIGIYAGSFDILTYGHCNIILKSLRLFNECHVLIANNPDKKYWFTPEERLLMLRNYFSLNNPKLTIAIWDKMVIDYRENNLAEDYVLIRGIRNMTDMMSEMILADTNRELGALNTIFIPCDNCYRNVSSSLVKELLKYRKDISKYVPTCIEKALKRKIE